MNYLKKLLLHKLFVLVAGLRVGGIPLTRLVLHDRSKFFPPEVGPYFRKYSGRSYTQEEWKCAWAHHIQRNPHHWNHWLEGGVPVPMPETYVREMIADWMAAGRAYKGNWNIQPWINENASVMHMHEETLLMLREILSTVGLEWPEE
jgi:hypothetical protein